MKRAVCFSITCAAIFLSTGTAAWSQEQSTPASTQGPPAYRLVGIVVVEGGSPYNAAVFEFGEVQAKQQKLYKIGDTTNGATLVEIRDQHVVLKRGEEIELVGVTAGCAEESKPANPKRGDSREVTYEAPNPQRQALEQVLSKQTPPYDPRVEKKGASRDQVDRLVEHFQQQVEKEPPFVETSLGSAISLASMDRDLLNSFGLKPTDLIVGISVMGIDSSERLPLIFGVLNRAKVFDLAVLRGDGVEYLAYEVQAVQ